MAKVILIQPPIREFYLTRKRTIPYGLASIAASLEQAGFDTEIIDALARDKSKVIDYPESFAHLKPYYGRQDVTLFSLFHQFRHFGYSHEHLAAMVRDRQPLIVGISSLFTAYQDQALETAKTVRRFYPDAYIVLGGHHPTVFPEKILDCNAVDFVVRGEGEASLPKLCRIIDDHVRKRPHHTGQLPEPGKLKAVPGIGFRENAGLFISAPAWVENLSRIPGPALEKTDHSYYCRNKAAAITVVASRGCPFPCSYCSVSASSSHSGFRQRRVEEILAEIRGQADEREIGFIDFEDENLTLKKDWFLELLGGIRQIFKGRQVELRAMNGLYPPSLDREIIREMRASGFKTLNLSLGSFSKKQLKRFKRPDVTDDHDRVVTLAEEFGLETVSYIIGAGPGQTARTTLEDLLMLARRRTLAGLSIFYPAPGSLDYEVCRKAEILPDDFSLMRSAALPLDHTTSRLEAVTLLRLSRILNYLKSLIDRYGCLPDPEIHTPETAGDLKTPGKGIDRHRISRKLVQWFLADGGIRGMDGKGEIYVHQADSQLTGAFLRGIQKRPVQGVRQGGAQAGTF
ncbi:MAG: B12-binding domain-containing radical SAM protein [Desulfobacterales bacterium]|nr:B12-binding domain-containing radical SAM protein [Desulfobacterales bacterium]